MTETPGGAPPASGQMSDRMQALLSAAAEEQVREQRAVSAVLGDLRGQVAALSEAIRGAASDATVERLGGVVSTVVADLRTSTSLLGQRIEALSKRVDAVAADTAAPTEQAAVRLAALSADVSAQGELVERMRASLDELAGFPGALAALQKDVAGLHDRLAPLAEVRASIGELGARTAHSLEALRPQVDGLQTKIDALTAASGVERLRDAIVDALAPRLEKLEEAAERPTAGPEALKAHFGDLRAALQSQAGERFDEVHTALGAVETRLGQVGQRVADVGDAAGGVPALAAELARLHSRVDELLALREQVGSVATGVTALQEDETGAALSLGLAGLRQDVEHLNERFPELTPPPAEEVAGLVSQRVADRLVETLAPRIADVVLTRVSAALVTQLGEALSPRVRADTEAVVRTATADSERRVLAHVDESVLALAEALLRRRRGVRTAAAASAAAAQAQPEQEDPAAAAAPVASAPVAEPEPEPEPEAEPEPEQTPAPTPEEPVVEVLDRLNAPAPSPAPTPVARPSVTTSLAPPRESAPPPAAPAPPVEAEAEPTQAKEPEKAPEPRKVAKAPAKAALKKAPAPMKKAARPPTKPPVKPILERTPDVPVDDEGPIRERPSRPPAPAATRPAPAPQPAPPAAAPPPPPPPPPAPQKRKPWWRPGG